MLIKYGSLVSAEKVTLADWRRLIVEASVHQDPERIETLAEFEIDKGNFLYVRARAVSAGEHYGANDNGDYFPEDELVKFHKTFVRRGVYVNHKSEDPAGAIGIILDAVWHGDKRKYVECLLAIDRNEPIARKIESGIAHSWSMGALVKECECSACGKRASSEAEYCECLRTAMGRSWNGKKVYAINHGLNFYELSNVTVPADPQAFTLQVLADRKEERLRADYLALADTYQGEIAKIAEKAAQDAVVTEVRKRIGQQDGGTQTDKQILGTVRHRLKVATAPLLPREGDKMRQRVKSALEAGASQAEQQKNSIAETSPLEGLNIMENNLTIRYLPGETLKDCYFIGRRGNLQVVVTAAELLDPATQKRIEAAEKAEKIKDDSKPKADHEIKIGDEDAQPGSKVNPLSANPAKEIKDDSKPTADGKMDLNGKDAAQPSDVVKRYAQLLGAKSVTFKKGENGSFTATLSGGTITRLANLWSTSPQPIRRTAKIAGEPATFSREEARGEGRDPRNLKEMTWAREDKRKDAAKASGSLGSEAKSYFQQLDSKNLAEGGNEGWAKKVNEMTRAANAKDAEIKNLKAQLDVLTKTVEAMKEAGINEKKSLVASRIMETMERVGALRVDPHAVLDLKEQGYSHEDAEIKAFANLRESKRAELKQMDLKSLESMASNLADLVPAIKATASKKDLELPRTSREETSLGDEDALSRAW